MRSIVHQALDVRRRAVPNLVFHCGRRHRKVQAAHKSATHDLHGFPSEECWITRSGYKIKRPLETGNKGRVFRSVYSHHQEFTRRGYRHLGLASITSLALRDSRNMAAIMARPPFHDQKTGVRYDCNNPDHAGWLRKESAWLKDWRPRFFVLKGSNLFFAKVGLGWIVVLLLLLLLLLLLPLPLPPLLLPRLPSSGLLSRSITRYWYIIYVPGTLYTPLGPKM